MSELPPEGFNPQNRPKVPVYISPSAFDLYSKNPEDYYVTYLSDFKVPRPPQLQVMSIGSSFDAYAKAWLHEKLFGKGKDPKFDFITLFEAQVEPQNRDWALVNGKYVFEKYLSSGALTILLLDLQKSPTEPRFEIEIKGAIDSQREATSRDMGSVVLMGKPDVFYYNHEGTKVIYDFKVNGYLSNYNKSPAKGYIALLTSAGYNEGKHKDAMPMMYKGSMINVCHPLEQVDTQWANQLAIYSWLVGANVGEENIVGIEQILCNPDKAGGRPTIKIAQHRTRVSAVYQHQLFDNLVNLWKIIHTEPLHFFPHMSLADSQAKCQSLDKVAAAMCGLSTPKDNWFARMTHD